MNRLNTAKTRKRRGRRTSFGGLLAVVLFAQLGSAHPSHAQLDAETDYALGNGEWNGLSELVQIATRAEVDLDTPPIIDVDALSPNDALLIVYPTQNLPVAALTAFLRRGGRVAIADDFGASTDFLSVFSIRRRPAPADAPQIRNNDALLVARPLLRHPLTEHVSHLVTNHPTVVQHENLEAAFGFGGESGGPVLTGAVEAGRLVVIGDPSVLINNMLRFHGNEVFAENLVRYLDGERGGRLYLVPPSIELRAGRSMSRAQAVNRLNDSLGKFASADAPAPALLLFGGTAVLLSLVFLIAAIPWRSPYSASVVPGPSGGGGFAARVMYALQHSAERAQACLVYRFEFIEALSLRLDLSRGSSIAELCRAAHAAGLAEPGVRELRKLLERLQKIAQQVDQPPGTPKVGASELQHMVDTGERLLQSLADAPDDSQKPHSSGTI